MDHDQNQGEGSIRRLIVWSAQSLDNSPFPLKQLYAQTCTRKIHAQEQQS